jgi:hypothetical protein
MVRRRASLGWIGVALMTLSLFLPLWTWHALLETDTIAWAPVYLCVFDPLGIAGRSGSLGLQLLSVALVAASALSLRLWPGWAWAPATLWLIGLVCLFWLLALRELMPLWRIPAPEPPHPLPWAWIAALTGATCVLLTAAKEGPTGRRTQSDIE